jgi:hypothetical protein
MSGSRRELVERLSGRGRVFRGEDWFSEVDYVLAVHQRVHELKRFSKSTEVDGLKEITGHIANSSSDLRDLSNATDLSLQLVDGQRLKFCLRNPATGEIVGIHPK